ncbi:hypothetical protein QOZ80_2BG0173580 [Eleusine coracana subsp. coracana]|nr:hypothetical protein QOZ80_2BG0173580 [Eleusine coracana subsp. coracana]
MLPPTGAAPPPSPTPESTPDSVATSQTVASATVSLSPTAPVSTPSLSPLACPFRPGGRSKEQRWSGSNPAFGNSSDPASESHAERTYRDVVLSVASVAGSADSLPLPKEKLPVRILLRSAVLVPQALEPDADGWMRVESQSDCRRRIQRPRRPVPVDLRGRCFNCFSGGHCAAACCSRPRCFKCQEIGHRSYDCPNPRGGASGQGQFSSVSDQRTSVWRRITLPAEIPVNQVERPLLMAGNVLDIQQAGAGDEPVALNDGASPARAPPCIIGWSDRLERAHADLRRAVFATVYGDYPNLSIADLKQTIASRFDLSVDTLVLRHAGNDLYILFVDDEATAVRLESAGPPHGSGVVRIHYRCWTRQAIASGAALPSLVDVELHGIPAHAWEMSTAESLLNPFGWPQRLDHATRNREDYSIFRVSAWCFKPKEVPRSRELHIVEPPVGPIFSPPGKPTLYYPVDIKVVAVNISGADNDFPPFGLRRR